MIYCSSIKPCLNRCTRPLVLDPGLYISSPTLRYENISLTMIIGGLGSITVRHRLLLLAAVLVLIQKLLHRNANLSDGLIAGDGTISHDLDD
ncbi:hypothetical protein Bca52824_081688 [Brassica carinata]|uniref:Uncharacterized protein n=1 Tax=Brassica carinata TaxID=52824 RepID=A0A8X7TRG9_BRACI|nr:hypothetical protein Bca52824_081688 [Brassica carinata]